MTIKAMGKFRKEVEWGELKMYEADDGGFGTVELVRCGVYIGDEMPPKNYIPLFDYLLLTYPKITRKYVKKVVKYNGFTKMWVEVLDNDDFWAHTNHKCMTCTKTCKQSSKVEVLTCPQYEEIKD